MPEVGYVDGMSVPNYEQRDPAPKYQMPFEVTTREVHADPGGVRSSSSRASPMIVKPIAMTFDERGRLWVIETVDYPNVARRSAGR